MQTDRPYSYLVPEAMQEQIAIGMRVHVPLVKNRLFEGLLLAWKISLGVLYNQPSARLLDCKQHQEQLDLADQMRHTIPS